MADRGLAVDSAAARFAEQVISGDAFSAPATSQG
jgi:hypothetical protein